jgi:hypothetical protein
VSGPSSCVKGREFNASQNCVQFLVVYLSLPKSFIFQRLVGPTFRSHHPAHQTASGTMNLQVMPHVRSSGASVGLSKWSYLGQFSTGSLECSGVIGVDSVGRPRSLTNLSSAMRNLSTDMSEELSSWCSRRSTRRRM